MSKISILLIQKYIPHYRIKIFEELSTFFNLSIIYSEESLQGANKDYSNLNIKKVGLFKIPKIGYFHKCRLLSIANKYDVVIVPIDDSLKSVERLKRSKRRKCKVISWGIGVLADRENRYDNNDSKDKVFISSITHSDAAVFYASYPVEKYSKLGINREKLFVANNTIFVDKRPIDQSYKDSIIFLGSLYKVKKVDLLIEQFSIALKTEKSVPRLIIIGEGEMKNALLQMVKDMNLEERVQIVGEITDDAMLYEWFQKAFACISPNQAGLSVLQSMAYGVPFITCKEAITGGEIFNISNGINGILFSEIDELHDIIIDIARNKKRFLKMGKNAYNYYWSSRTPNDMVKGFVDAVYYSLGEINDKK